jgi:hypothetical protein
MAVFAERIRLGLFLKNGRAEEIGWLAGRCAAGFGASCRVGGIGQNAESPVHSLTIGKQISKVRLNQD